MNSQRWEEVQVSFDELVELGETERMGRLVQLAVSDPELHRVLQSLLAADAEADAHLAPVDAALLPGFARRSDPLGLAGRTISHFQLQEALGAGGMGVVYRAEDVRLGRAVALKFLLPSYGLDASAETRFLREARVVAALDHRNLCAIHEVGVSDDGRPFLAMALYPGETLRARLARDGPMPVSEVLAIARQVAEGLECAHGAGIVHRDLKPGNVMLLPDGTVKILDFGLAKARDQSLSDPGARFGTASYMAPEQIRGEAVDERTDLWAVGVVLYEMLTARKPFSGEQDIAIAHAILHDEPVPLSTHRRDVSGALEDLVFRLLEKDRARRHATASELLSELARVDLAARETIGSRRRRRRRSGVPQLQSARSRRLIPMATGAGVATIAALAATSVLARKPAPPPPDRVQLTLTGNAVIPAISADGSRLVFGEKQCNETGHCTYQLVIQDIDGSSRIVLTRNLAWVWGTMWSDDGRFLLFNGSYGPSRWGLFAISTLGGEPRHLGCCFWNMLGDTAFVSPLVKGDPLAWVRLITVHDGQTVDSLPVRDPGELFLAIPTYPDRLFVVAWKTRQSAPEFRLTDFRGEVLDRMTPVFGSLGRRIAWRWVPSTKKVVIASQRVLAGAEYDVLSLDLTRSRIGRTVDTVISGIEFRHGLFEVSRDGERLVYYAGPVESSLSTIEVDRTRTKLLAATPVLSSTTLLRGRMSSAGDKILVARDVPRGDGHASQFSIIRQNGGDETRIAGVVENLLDFEWSPRGAGFMYLHGIGGGKIRLVESDIMGRRTREIAWLEESAAFVFHPLPDGSVSIIPPERRSISVIRRPGKRDVTWRVPEWMSEISLISRSPDGKSLAVVGATRSRDSAVVATVDVETGRFARLASQAAIEGQAITWLEDGAIMFVLRVPEGAYVVYRVSPGSPAERLGTLPHIPMLAAFSVSKDGSHIAAISYNDKNDVYMIRNFGQMLRR